MVGEWTETTIGDHFEIKHGFAYKGEHFRDEGEGDVLVTPGNFQIGGGFTHQSLKRYVGPEVQGYELPAGEIVVTMTDLSKAGDTLGYSAKIPSDGRRYLHNQRIGRLLPRVGSKVTPDFAYWVMRTTAYRHHVLGAATGSTVKHTAPSRIQSYRFCRPPLPVQQQVTTLLGALDDKIELNRRLAETLEATARALFKSWFVDFEPVRGETATGATLLPDELAQLFPTSLDDGGLPVSWKEGSITELAQVNPSTPLRTSSAAYVDMAALPTAGPSIQRVARRPPGSGARFRNGDTLIARITPCLENGKTALVDCLEEGEVGWGSTEFIVLRPRENTPPALPYLLARHPPFRDALIAAMSGTSGRQRVQADAVLRWPMAIPSPNVLSAFGGVVNPTFEAITQLSVQRRTLADLRDTLLPKLISGELRIRDAEHAVAAA